MAKKRLYCVTSLARVARKTEGTLNVDIREDSRGIESLLASFSFTTPIKK